VHRGRLLALGAPPALLADFGEEVYEVRGGRREEVDAALSRIDRVLWSSPAGSQLRLVVARGAGPLVREALAPLGADIVRGAPNFEDLFLARMRKEAA
jgi:hypothetical protein